MPQQIGITQHNHQKQYYKGAPDSCQIIFKQYCVPDQVKKYQKKNNQTRNTELNHDQQILVMGIYR